LRILLIEDSTHLQRSLSTGLGEAGHAVDVVGDGERGLVFSRRGHYDLIILDLMLPRLSGEELLERLRGDGFDTQVLILSAKGDLKHRVGGLRAGADDYLPKPFAFDELLARVEALGRRVRGSKNPTIEVDDLSIDRTGKQVAKNGQGLTLTKREYRLLEYLAQRRGEIVSRIEIEDYLYTESQLPESNSVESAISSIRRKMRSCGGDNPNPIRTCHGQGYCLE